MRVITTFKEFLCLIFIILLASCSNEESYQEDNLNQINQVNVSNHNYSLIESELNTLINEERTSLGLNELQLLSEVSIEAIGHSDYMLVNEQVSHDNFASRVINLQLSVNADNVAENVGYGYNSAASFVQAWINSSGHYGNIIGDFTHVGVSVQQDQEGYFYVTQIYVKI